MTIWWHDAAVEEAVTQDFICSNLTWENSKRLKHRVGFSEFATSTYLEWLQKRAKRLYLILADIGIADQIFDLVDKLWEDNDLPIPLEMIKHMSLQGKKVEKLEEKFYNRQFVFLFKKLQKGMHLSYEKQEIVPLELQDKKLATPAGRGPCYDRVTLPNEPGRVFYRRYVDLRPESRLSELEQDFLGEVNKAKILQHSHLVSYWSSYCHEGFGYVLFEPAADYSLNTLLAATPASIKNVDKQARRKMVMDWIFCLVNTVSFMHGQGKFHGSIEPSTILFTRENHITYSDCTSFNKEMPRALTDNSQSFSRESYDYIAPEQWSAFTAMRERAGLCTSQKNASTFFSSRHGSDSRHSDPGLPCTSKSDIDMQAADLFSLGCIILELLSFLLKRHGKPFAIHRAAKKKKAGRGGAGLDTSFHQNMAQVESWMLQLAKDTAMQEEPIFKGVIPILYLVAQMMQEQPADRISIHLVRARMYRILRKDCGMMNPHCAHQYDLADFEANPSGQACIRPAQTSMEKRSMSQGDSMEYVTASTGKILTSQGDSMEIDGHIQADDQNSPHMSDCLRGGRSSESELMGTWTSSSSTTTQIEAKVKVRRWQFLK